MFLMNIGMVFDARNEFLQQPNHALTLTRSKICAWVAKSTAPRMQAHVLLELSGLLNLVDSS